MSRIGLLGDTHMDLAWVLYAIDKFSRKGLVRVIQVGDFGLYDTPAGQHFLDEVSKALSQAGIVLYVVPGNHEDYDYIESIPVDEQGWQNARLNIRLAPRGHRWMWEGRSFVALGGAPSVDRQIRISSTWPGMKLWWSQEMITEADVDNVIDGGYADVMVAHDAPIIPQIDDEIRGNPHGFSPDDLAYADVGRKRIHRAAHGVKPKVFLHGHYHFKVQAVKHWASMDTGYFSSRDIIGTTEIVGLSCNNSNYSLGALDLDTLYPLVWDIMDDYYEWVYRTENGKQ